MKRLAGELGRVCRSAVLTGLWYVSKDSGSGAAHVSRGITQVRARQEVLLPWSYRSPVAHRYLLVGVMACSRIDVAAFSIFLVQHCQCDFDGSGCFDRFCFRTVSPSALKPVS